MFVIAFLGVCCTDICVCTRTSENKAGLSMKFEGATIQTKATDSFSGASILLLIKKLVKPEKLSNSHSGLPFGGTIFSDQQNSLACHKREKSRHLVRQKIKNGVTD